MLREILCYLCFCSIAYADISFVKGDIIRMSDVKKIEIVTTEQEFVAFFGCYRTDSAINFHHSFGRIVGNPLETIDLDKKQTEVITHNHRFLTIPGFSNMNVRILKVTVVKNEMGNSKLLYVTCSETGNKEEEVGSYYDGKDIDAKLINNPITGGILAIITIDTRYKCRERQAALSYETTCSVLASGDSTFSGATCKKGNVELDVKTSVESHCPDKSFQINIIIENENTMSSVTCVLEMSISGTTLKAKRELTFVVEKSVITEKDITKKKIVVFSFDTETEPTTEMYMCLKSDGYMAIFEVNENKHDEIESIHFDSSENDICTDGLTLGYDDTYITAQWTKEITRGDGVFYYALCGDKGGIAKTFTGEDNKLIPAIYGYVTINTNVCAKDRNSREVNCKVVLSENAIIEEIECYGFIAGKSRDFEQIFDMTFRLINTKRNRLYLINGKKIPAVLKCDFYIRAFEEVEKKTIPLKVE